MAACRCFPLSADQRCLPFVVWSSSVEDPMTLSVSLSVLSDIRITLQRLYICFNKF